MANKVTLEFDGLDEMLKDLENFDGAVKKATETALQETAKQTQQKIDKIFIKSNMPAKGKYATGRTKRSILHNSKVYWEGTVASIDIGFDFDKSGLISVFLMYGTPKMKPVKGLKATIYGKKAKEERTKIQKDVFNKFIEELT